MTRVCKTCGREFEYAKQGRKAYCDLCRKADPHRHTRRQLPQMFVSVDCETKEFADGQFAVSVSFGRADGTSDTLNSPKLKGRQIARWLIDTLSGHYVDAQGQEWIQAYVAFYFDHDIAAIAKDWEPGNKDLMLIHASTATKVQRGQLCDTEHKAGENCEKIHRRDPETIQKVITEGGEGGLLAWDPETGMAIATTRKRRTKIEYRPHGDRMESNQRIDIHDTGSAFVGGLETAIDKWKPTLSDEQRDWIAKGKKARQYAFPGWSDRDFAAYSEAECVAHARMCHKLLDTIRTAAKVKVSPDRLFGSGSIAEATLSYYGAPTRKDTQETLDSVRGIAIDAIAEMTYFGGLIDTPVIGLLSQPVDSGDINSAYPSAMIHLPCMRTGHGHWEEHDGLAEGVIGHSLVSWNICRKRRKTSTGPFQIRSALGSVFTPESGDMVWVTLVEAQTGKKRFKSNVTVHKSVVWVQDCDCPNPLYFLKDLYDARLAIRCQMATLVAGSPEWQELNAQQEAIKLVINSVYGKLAQQYPNRGRFTNLHYAAYITGRTRSMVRERSWWHEDQGGIVVYQHTDSVKTIGGHEIDEGTALGAWGKEQTTDHYLVLQPGLAGGLNGGKFAARGVPKKGMDEPTGFRTVIREWAANNDFTKYPAEWNELVLPRVQMITRSLAMAQGHPEQAGMFLDRPLTVSFQTPKRDIIRATPLPGNPDAWQIPLWAEMPEPAATLLDVRKMRGVWAADKTNKTLVEG